jgi:hypothetical protein
VAVAIKSAQIVREYEGPYTNQITYRRRCDTCGYYRAIPLITVRCLLYETVVHGCGHGKTYICSFCGFRQEVQIEG